MGFADLAKTDDGSMYLGPLSPADQLFVEAFEKEDLAEMKCALDQGANPNLSPSNDSASVNYIIMNNDELCDYMEMLQIVLSYGASARLPELMTGLLPLSTAVSNNNLQIMDLLLQYGAQVNERDVGQFAWTPIFHASSRGFLEAAAKLIAHGAVVTKQSAHGYTPLQIAYYCGHNELCELLLKHMQ